MEAGATIHIQKRSQDRRSHEDLYHSERLCWPSSSHNGELAVISPVTPNQSKTPGSMLPTAEFPIMLRLHPLSVGA